MKIPLEDNFSDVLGKSQRGLKLSDDQLSAAAGISKADLVRVKEGTFDESIIRKLAQPLKLKESALVELGMKSWYPADLGQIDGLASYNTTYEDMTVNSYFCWDPNSLLGVCFDTGAEASGMTKLGTEKKIRIQLILLTHTHPDHIADLAHLKKATGAAAYVSKFEPLAGAESFAAGKEFTVGNLKIESRQTSGHSSGGITYVVHGLSLPVAIVGDSMFAASMGGGMISYEDAVRNNVQQILTLPPETIICPGHGPLTTVGEQREHNPFFP